MNGRDFRKQGSSALKLILRMDARPHLLFVTYKSIPDTILKWKKYSGISRIQEYYSCLKNSWKSKQQAHQIQWENFCDYPVKWSPLERQLVP